MPGDLTLSDRTNFCRAWPADLKLVLALLAIVVAGCIEPEQWPATAAVAVILFIGHAFAGSSYRWMLSRSAAWLATLAALGVTMWWSYPTAESGLWLWSFFVRCVVAVLAGLWLMQVLSAQEFLATLRRWRVPGLFLVIVSFILRYLIVLWEEHERLLRAQQSRGLGAATGSQRWFMALERVGLLLLRSLDRSERIHRAMLARGWDGSPRGLD